MAWRSRRIQHEGGVVVKYEVRFMTLTGAFQVAKREVFPSHAAAEAAIRAYAAEGGFSNVKAIDDDEDERFTARTPGGRAGRNIAYCGPAWGEA